MAATMLFSCGNNEEKMENPMQEESSEPNMGSNVNPSSGVAPRDEAELTETDPEVGGYEIMPSQTISENITSYRKLHTLASAIRQGGLVNTLNETGPYTVFAPSDEAFEALPDGVLDELMEPENKARLAEILKNHVVSGKLTSTDLKNGAMLNTASGVQLKVTKQGSKVLINGAEVTEPDAMSENGVIHIIEDVIVVNE